MKHKPNTQIQSNWLHKPETKTNLTIKNYIYPQIKQSETVIEAKKQTYSNKQTHKFNQTSCGNRKLYRNYQSRNYN